MNPDFLLVVIKVIVIAYASRLGLGILAEVIDELRKAKRKARR